MQVALLLIAGRDDEGLRHSAAGLMVSTAIGVGLLTAASFADGTLQGALWAIALVLDVGGPLVIDSSGWRLMPEHFAERHGLIVIIALGESIVAIGVGAEVVGMTAGVVVAAVLGTAVAGALWWLYFDVVALVAARRLENAAPGKEQNEIARDSFSYLHFAMVAGIVLLALGLKKTLEHTDEALKWVPATALLGGTRDLPARPRRLPLAQHPHAQPPAAGDGDRAAAADPGRARGPGAGRARRPGRAARRARRLRGDPLRRGARAPAPAAAARRGGGRELAGRGVGVDYRRALAVVIAVAACAHPAAAAAHDPGTGASAHAGEHARQDRAMVRLASRWQALPPARRRAERRRAGAVAQRALQLSVDAPAEQIGRWSRPEDRIPLPLYAINSVVMPTGKVLMWGRPPVDPASGTRANTTPAFLWDPAHPDRPAQDVTPQLDLDGDGDLENAPVFCSGQSLLPDGRVLAAGGTLAYPDEQTGTSFKGLDLLFLFDPWTERWSIAGRMRHGRWYPSQVELADGRIAILAGLDETGSAADNRELELYDWHDSSITHAPAGDAMPGAFRTSPTTPTSSPCPAARSCSVARPGSPGGSTRARSPGAGRPAPPGRRSAAGARAASAWACSCRAPRRAPRSWAATPAIWAPGATPT